ncbi:MAG: hypothetical protein ACI9Y1_002493 [Lentisphaeria bacterium]|jgi:hypothetical protein
MKSNDHEFAQKVVSAIEQESEALDVDTLDRLALLRKHALDAIPNKTSFFSSMVWPKYATMASASALVFALLLAVYPLFKNDPMPLLTMTAIEVLAEGEDLDMMDEDLEFYVWLESELDMNQG